MLRSPEGDHRKSRSRAKALVTSFVDVLLFSFQGSNYNAALFGDLIIYHAGKAASTGNLKKTSDSGDLFSMIIFWFNCKKIPLIKMAEKKEPAKLSAGS
ncbi:hypothetical protein BB776_00895 [Planococcus salinarum]|uniref:Uncharacterized protein n=1 Tax=Planococcus salinarum TaxID=622695 RepID=A0ABX3CYV4_9BACL|nr:hypothetical protein BB776_00895 [Planococcus salinarum]